MKSYKELKREQLRGCTAFWYYIDKPWYWYENVLINQANGKYDNLIRWIGFTVVMMTGFGLMGWGLARIFLIS